MNRLADIQHLYAFRGDERLIILGSEYALKSLAQVVRMLTASAIRQISLSVIEFSNEGPSIPLLKCARNEEPLKCTVDDSCVSISGSHAGLEYLATSLEARAATWRDGGHCHLYPGEEFSDDRGGHLTSPEPEEILIGGYGYLDDLLFGLPTD